MRLIDKVPLTCEDLLFVKWITASYAFNKAMKGIQELTDENEASIQHISAIKIFCAEIDPMLGSLPIALPIDANIEYEKFQLSAKCDDTDLSLLRVYFHINNMVLNYESDLSSDKEQAKILVNRSFKFFHNGKTFILRGKDAAQFEDIYKLSANEAIEVLEFKRVAGQNAKVKGDDEGDYNYNSFLAQLAILCRPEGVELPLDKTERDAFIESNMIELQKASFQTIRDIDFFLIIILKQSLEKITAPYLSKAYQSLDTSKKKKATFKPQRKIGRHK